MAVPAFATETDGDPAVRLYDLLSARLGLMQDVAAFKWLQGRPVEDLEREATVLAVAGSDGLRYGVRMETSERLMRVQIEAAKDIQHYWFDRWKREPRTAPEQAPDLAGEIRPALIELGGAILEASVADELTHDRQRFDNRVQVTGLGEARRGELFNAVSSMARYPDRLTQILESGRLRVGTTGDYAPFSHSEDGVHFSGVDVAQAGDLARSLGVELEIVHTSWPSLSEDLLRGRYDIAMGGVSLTEARARIGYLSVPYYSGGKTPISRCEDSHRLASLEDIDQPGIRVIVNPGGTNEAFVDQQIQQATKILHPDNRTIFAALADGGADVMITDRIEVLLRTRRDPRLCATMDANLTRQEKGYLMPRDTALRDFVDRWLEARVANGTVSELIEAQLSSVSPI